MDFLHIKCLIFRVRRDIYNLGSGLTYLARPVGSACPYLLLTESVQYDLVVGCGEFEFKTLFVLTLNTLFVVYFDCEVYWSLSTLF